MYYVYVIGLKKEVLKNRKFRDANPDYDAGKPCYYVGYTSKLPHDRALEHQHAKRKTNGHPLFSRMAHRYFDGLRHRKYQHLNPVETQEEAKALEKATAERLRHRGFGVWWN